MKLEAAGSNIVIGKRVTLGAVINSIVLIAGIYFPQHQQALLAAATPLTFFAQVYVGNTYSITTK